MHRSHSLAQSGSLMRAFFLFVLLIGVQFTALTSFVVAKGAGNTIGNPRLASNKPQAVKPQHTTRKTSPRVRALGVGPDLGISIIPSNPTYSVGSTVGYTLTVSNSSTADPIASNATPVSVTDVISAGLSNVAVTSSPAGAWSFTGANPTSPALIVATYTGPFPITAGEVLPTISVTGTANDQATGLLSNTGTVVVAGDLNLSNNTTTVSVNIVPAATPISTTGVVATVTVALPTTTVSVVPTITEIAFPTTTAIAFPTTTAIAFPTTTAIAFPTATVVAPPAITISDTVEGAATAFQVGEPVTYDLIVTDSNTAGPTTGPITVSDVIPLGLAGLVATGTGWTTNLTGTVGPALLTATYASVIAPGETIPPLRLTGVLTATAGSTVSNSAQVFAAANSATTPSSNVSVINVASVVTPTSTLVSTAVVGTATAVSFPCTVSSITLPCIATATAAPCSAPIVGTVAPIVIATTATPVTATGCSSGPDLSIVGTTLTGGSDSSVSTAPDSSLSTAPSVSAFTEPGSSTFTDPSSSTLTDPSTSTFTSPGQQYTVGDRVTYVWMVSDLPDGGPDGQPITVGDVLPIGAKDIHVSGSNWGYSISDKTSPSVITATYTGLFPIPAGTVLSPILISMTLTKDAGSSFTTTATVDTLGDINMANNAFTDTMFVKEKPSTDNNDNNNNNDNNHNQNNDNNQHNNQNNDNNQHNNQNNQNNQNNNQNNQNNNNCNCNNHAPGLPGTGSDPSLHIAARVE